MTNGPDMGPATALASSDLRKDTEVWGSDVIADALAEQAIPYVCLVPGASFRGLHDSIVNYLGDRGPRMLVCLHEEHSVAIAHGWAQVTNEPIAAIIHTNVGLMHATMAIFNVWCDRMPALLIGASGPFDAEKRRPWIDWIHSAADLGALIRDYTKWDDQPGSAVAAVDAIRRGVIIAKTSPMGPVYINLDVTIQEERVEQKPSFHDLSNYQPPNAPVPAGVDIDRAFDILSRAKSPVMLVGRVSRGEVGWVERVRLAETFNMEVFSIYNSGGGFPKSHPLHRDVAKLTLDDATCDRLRAADAILSLDWTDLGGLVKQVWPSDARLPDIISCSDDFYNHRGWSKDYHHLPPAVLRIGTRPECFVSALLGKAAFEGISAGFAPEATGRIWSHKPAASGSISVKDLAAIFADLTKDDLVTLVTRPFGWPHMANPVEHPLDFLGSKGGEGLGAGPGILVGAALAIRDRHPERIAVAILGDGDFLMGASALWTAASERIPLLAIVANNRSYHNDVVHQERVAMRRGRPVENKWEGLRIDDPAPDLSMHARSLGLEAAGPVEDLAELRPVLAIALERVRTGASYVLDVRIESS